MIETIDQILDRWEVLRQDSERRAMTSLLLRPDDVDDWDQVAATMDAYRESTKDWRVEAKERLEAEFAAVRRSTP
jgi:hypothetical protein